MYGVGAIAGPFLAAAAMSATGPGGLYSFTALVHGVFLLYILNRTLRRGPSPAERHRPFDEALKAARTTSQVYEDEMD
jgi:hypothetical protein